MAVIWPNCKKAFHSQFERLVENLVLWFNYSDTWFAFHFSSYFPSLPFPQYRSTLFKWIAISMYIFCYSSIKFYAVLVKFNWLPNIFTLICKNMFCSSKLAVIENYSTLIQPNLMPTHILFSSLVLVNVGFDRPSLPQCLSLISIFSQFNLNCYFRVCYTFVWI